VGILVVRKLTRTARSLTPAGLADSASRNATGLTAAIREFTTDVREAMAEREEELMAALGDDDSERGPRR
jgi:hypothetical protein